MITQGIPCNHPGCLNHISHPCEGCGRIGGQGVVTEEHENQFKKFLPFAISLCRSLSSYHYRYSNEKDLQQGVAAILTNCLVSFEAEVVLSPRNRIDFMVNNTIGIECKVDGTVNQLIRQLGRYAATGKVSDLIVVTTKSTHKTLPETISEIPISIVVVSPFL